jgi:integrase
MASLFKPWITRYIDSDGRQVKSSTLGARKVKERASKWYGQFTDQHGQRHRMPLCSDKAAARQMLAKHERDAARSSAGLTDPFAEHRKAPIGTHVAGYEARLRLKEVSAQTLKEDMRRLRTVIADCGFRSLDDITPAKVEKFLVALAERRTRSATRNTAILAEQGTGAATRNTYLKSIKAFCRWCEDTDRMPKNPLVKLKPHKGDLRRNRRALTEDELNQIIQATMERPLAWAMTIRRGKNKGKLLAKPKPETIAKVKQQSWEHQLIYKCLVLTGLRRGELEALEVRHLTLTGARPCLRLPKRQTKNRKGADLPLRPDLTEDLKRWLAVTGKRGSDRVFHVSESAVLHVLRRDLAWAGIPYKDELGRTVDVHSLRHTTATHLAKAGVQPTIAKEFMRHSDINLTLAVYTDPRLLSERQALDALPNLPLEQEHAPRVGKATG